MKQLLSLISFLLLSFSASFAQTNTWISTAPMSIPLSEHGAALLPNGTVFITGGFNNAAFPVSYSTTEVYGPVTNTWSSGSPMPAPRAAHATTQLADGRIVVVGGLIDDTSTPSNSVFIYDLPTNTWTTAQAMATNRSQPTATLLNNNKVLVTGGSPIRIAGYETNSTELYDPAVNSWTTVAPMDTPRGGHTATLLPNGKVLVTGGSSDDTALATTELYDPVANTWTAAASMPEERYLHRSVLLTNGKVLVIGGSGSSCLLYDPVTNTWSTAVSLPGPRAIHTATMLPSGNVFVTGGTSSNTYLSSTNTTFLFDIAPSLTNVQATGCGQSVTLTATTSYSLGPYSYTITDGSTPVVSGTTTGTAFSQSFIPTGSVPKTYTLTIETEYARVSAAASTIQLGSTAVAGTITISGPASCSSPSRLTAPATGSSFVFTGPGGYVFSNVYRNGGSYTAFAEGIKLGGTYTLTVYGSPGCPSSTSTVVVQGPGSCL